MTDILQLVDINELRHRVREKYREVALNPAGAYLFHTGRPHAVHLGYRVNPLNDLPEEACEAFAGVGDPFFWGGPLRGEKVVDLGSGAGMDTLLAALWVGTEGRVIGVDMTPEMLERSRATVAMLGLQNVEYREGLLEDLPIEAGWADVVISNGGISLCPNKLDVFRQIFRVLRSSGRMTIADTCTERPVHEDALRDIELWTGGITAGLSRAGWEGVIHLAGLVDIDVANPRDTFASARGEASAREFGTLGCSIRARRPGWRPI